MRAVDVAAGIILNPVKTKVLVAKRNTVDSHIGKWEFPGGKIDADESAGQALKRELAEELGIDVLSLQEYEFLVFDYSNKRVNLNFFMVMEYTGQASGLEGQEIRWVKLDELHQLQMLEANVKIIERLTRQYQA